MTKKLLLAASALSALAAATSATAQSTGYTLALSNVDGTANNAIEAPLVIADELTIPSTGLDTLLELALTPTTSAVLPTGNALLTIDLGADSFGTAVTAAAVLQSPGSCNPTRTVAFGGGALQSSVTFLLSNLGGCNNANPIELVIPFEVDDETNVTISSTFTTEGSTPIDGGSASISNAISFASAFAISVAADTVGSAVADVAANPTYSNLETGFDAVLGAVSLAINTTRAKDFWQVGDAPAAPVTVTTTDVTDITVLVTTPTGSFDGLSATVDGLDLNVDQGADDAAGGSDDFESGDATITASISATDSFSIAIVDDTGVIEGATFAVTATLNLISDFTDETATGSLQPVTLGGTNFVVPWVAINSNNGSTATIRIANGDDLATGPLTLTLTSWAGGAPSQTVCDDADLAKLSSIAANGIVSIQPNDLTTCFGTAVTNGDIQVTVQGGEEYLTAKARLTRNDVTSEISLGRLGETDETF